MLECKSKYNHTNILFSITMLMVSLISKTEYNPMIYDLDEIMNI